MEIRNLGLISYTECWDLQKNFHTELISGVGPEIALLCSHPKVITIGRSTKPEHLIVSKVSLEDSGYEVFEVERGGSVTYHGPEQLLLYPILNLEHRRKDVGWYMRTLEQIIIDTLYDFNIASGRIPGKTGVWAGPAKIGFIGVRISRWRTLHGLSINLNPCNSHFSHVNPCGLGKIPITSMEEEISGNFDRSEVEKSLAKHFIHYLGVPYYAVNNLGLVV